eukprot:SAG11_NODE_16548_length_544_cov_1.253933_1_plen_68_part_00
MAVCGYLGTYYSCSSYSVGTKFSTAVHSAVFSLALALKVLQLSDMVKNGGLTLRLQMGKMMFYLQIS